MIIPDYFLPTKIVQASLGSIVLTLLLFLVLACQGRITPTKSPPKGLIYPPHAFTLKAKIGLIGKQDSYLFSLLWQQKSRENWQLKIESLSIVWELNIAYKDQTTWVNNQIIDTSLEDYLVQNYRFDLPVNLLRHLLFFPKQEKLVYANWQVADTLTQIRFKNPTIKHIRLQNKKGDILTFKVLDLW